MARTIRAAVEACAPTGTLDLRAAHIAGDLDLRDLCCGSVWLTGATVGGDVMLDDAHVGGDVWLAGADVGGDVWLDGARVGRDVQLDGTTVGGSVRLAGAAVGGDVRIDRADVGGNVVLYRADVGGNVMLYRAHVGEDVRIVDADVGGDVWLPGADIGGDVLRAGATVIGDVWLSDATVIGGSTLSEIEADQATILDLAPDEVPALRAALVAGQVDGSCYEGDCCCLVGTLTAAGAVDLPRDSRRPAERYYQMIAPGHGCDRNDAARLAVEWIDRWTAQRAAEGGAS